MAPPERHPLFEKLFAAGSIVVFKWQVERGWKVDFVSPNVTLFGYQPEQFLSGEIEYATLVHPEDLERIACELRSHLEAGVDFFEQEYRLRLSNGSYVSLYDFTTVLRNADGTIELLGYVQDVSQVCQLREALTKNESDLKALLNAVPDSIMVIDREGRYVPNPLTRLKRDRARLIGYCLHDVFPFETADRLLNTLQYALDEQVTLTVEYEFLFPEGSIWYSGTLSPLDHDQVVWFARDITAQKLFDQQLEEQVQQRTAELQQAVQFESLLKQISDRVRDSFDEDEILQTVVELLSKGVERIVCCDVGLYDSDCSTFTIKHEYLSGSNLSPAYGKTFPFEGNPHPEIYTHLMKGEYCHFCDISPEAIRDNQIGLACLAHPILDDRSVLGDLWLFKPGDSSFSEREIRLIGQIANQCGIALRQSRLYQVAQKQMQQMSRLSQLKDDFISTVSHELRTPMANIKVSTRMLETAVAEIRALFEEDSIPPALTKANLYLDILNREANRESNLINDLLDLSHLEHNPELELQVVALELMIPEIIKSFQPSIEKHEQQLRFNTLPLPPLMTEAKYVERILTELIQNACKYTPEGGFIHILATPLSPKPQLQPHLEGDSNLDPASSLAVSIQVTNGPVSIEPDQLPYIFDRFYRIPNNDPWKYGGTGLGLALARQMVSRLKGTITARSQGERVCFEVQLPESSA